MAKKRMSAGNGRKEGTLGGFTIIEVVLVLAIAGLIFLMVFIALPARQRSQRDTQRRQDLGRMTDYIAQFQTNNNGRLPKDGTVDAKLENDDGVVPMTEYDSVSASDAKRLITSYINSVNSVNNEYTDPSGYAYGIQIVNDLDVNGEYIVDATKTNFDKHLIYIVKSAQCSGEKSIKSTNSRDYTVMYVLESAGTYCQDNGS